MWSTCTVTICHVLYGMMTMTTAMGRCREHVPVGRKGLPLDDAVRHGFEYLVTVKDFVFGAMETERSLYLWLQVFLCVSLSELMMKMVYVLCVVFSLFPKLEISRLTALSITSTVCHSSV